LREWGEGYYVGPVRVRLAGTGPAGGNFGKRLVKSPKVYFVDSGLACHLLGIDSEKELKNSSFLGPLFEGFVAAEIVKVQTGTGRRRELYYFRDQQGLEVDFVLLTRPRHLVLLEARAAHTIRPEMAASLDRLARAVAGYEVSRRVVYRPLSETAGLSVLRPGVRSLADLLEEFWPRRES
jgi:hypothetical protein